MSSTNVEYGVGLNEESILDARNKRLIQINYFYYDYYTATNDILKVLILTFSLMLFILFVHRMIGSLFRFGFFVVYSLICSFGLLYSFYKFIKISQRNNQDFNMIQFNFNKKAAPTLGSTGGSTTTSANLPSLYSCVNSDCCSDNQTFDKTLQKCITNSSPSSSSSSK